MRIFFLAVLAALPLHAADERKLALESAAQADYARVAITSTPDVALATNCVQSQAMLAAIATPEEMSLVVFRQGYCELARASATENRAAFEAAAEIFNNAIADAQAVSTKQKLPESVPATWRVLAAVARLNGGSVKGAAGQSPEISLSAAMDAASANGASGRQSDAAAIEFCHTVQQVGSAWLGWIALGRGDFPGAARRFRLADTPPWDAWIEGVSAFRRGDYGAAAADYGRAIGMWRDARLETLAQRLCPHPDISEALTDWGGAQLAAGYAAAALANLNAAVKANSGNARAYYLLGEAHRRLGRDADAAEDFDVAGRAALAQTGEAGAAEAHFYRGIVFYLRKEFVRAEDEFSSALNGGRGASWMPDARAWRYLAAVSGGACGPSREYLERALASVSAYFPKAQAVRTAASCPAASIPAVR